MLREEPLLRDVQLVYMWPLAVLHVKHVAVHHAHCSYLAKRLQIFPSFKKNSVNEEKFQLTQPLYMELHNI